MRFSIAVFGSDGMKFHYYPDTDSLYIELSPAPGVDSEEVRPGIVLDLDAAGHLVGIDIDRASERVDISRIEATALPFSAVRLER
jgi:uncharacterized protein YuzE